MLLVLASALVMKTPYGWVLAALAVVAGGLAVRRDVRPRWRWVSFLWPVGMAGVLMIWSSEHWYELGGVGNLRHDDPTLNLFLAAYAVGCGLVVWLNRGQRALAVAVLSVCTIIYLGVHVLVTMAVMGMSW